MTINDLKQVINRLSDDVIITFVSSDKDDILLDSYDVSTALFAEISKIPCNIKVFQA